MLKNEISGIDFNEMLTKRGFKKTPTRVAIINIFTQNDKPINADFIYKKLKGNIDEATIYRTLTSFLESGILKKIDLRKSSSYFELNNDHHHHIVCMKCGFIEDFKENKGIEKLLDQVVSKSSKFKSIKEHSLELFGFCKVCNH